MTITEATVFFKKALKETTNKREIKVYKEFVTILSNLTTRDLSEKQIIQIVGKINSLDLQSNPNKKRAFFSKKLSIFKKFLKDEFSFTTEGHYTAMYMALGMCFGVPIGASFSSSGVATGIVIGMLIGLAYGKNKDKEALKNNLILKNN